MCVFNVLCIVWSFTFYWKVGHDFPCRPIGTLGSSRGEVLYI
jgi:hypothetical protein